MVAWVLFCSFFWVLILQTNQIYVTSLNCSWVFIDICIYCIVLLLCPLPPIACANYQNSFAANIFNSSLNFRCYSLIKELFDNAGSMSVTLAGAYNYIIRSSTLAVVWLVWPKALLTALEDGPVIKSLLTTVVICCTRI